MRSGELRRAVTAAAVSLVMVSAGSHQTPTPTPTTTPTTTPSISLPDASPGSGVDRMPGAGLIESMVSWAWWIAMLMSAVSLLLAGGAYGYFYWNSKSQQASTALKVVAGTLVGALLVGGGGVLVNTLFGFGFRAF